MGKTSKPTTLSSLLDMNPKNKGPELPYEVISNKGGWKLDNGVKGTSY
jgi:hypothetical protein